MRRDASATRPPPRWMLRRAFALAHATATAASSSASSPLTSAAMSASQATHKPLDVTGAFKTFLSMPTITRAKFVLTPAGGDSGSGSGSGSGSVPSSAPLAPVWVNTQVKNVQLDESKTWQQTYVPNANGTYAPFGFPTLLDTLATLRAPSRRLMASVRAAPSKDGAKGALPAYIIDITDTDPRSPSFGRVLQSISTAGQHGRVMLTGNFGGFAWGLDECTLVYMAEPKPEDRKAANYFPSSEEAERQRAAAGPTAAPTKGTEYEAREDWGEQMVGVQRPRPFVLRWSPTEADSAKIYTVKGIPDDCSAGQVIFAGWRESEMRKPPPATAAAAALPKFGDAAASAPTAPLFDEGLYLTIYPNEQGGGARRLGMIYYNTRESKVCYLSAQCIVDPLREAEEKRGRERAEKVARDTAARERREAGKPDLTEAEEKVEADQLQARRHREAQHEKALNRLIVLTPNDFSAQCPRLDGFAPTPQLVYVSTDEVWHHCSSSKLKTFIALPATLQRFMQMVDQPYEGAEEAAATAAKVAGDSAAGSSASSSPSPSPSSPPPPHTQPRVYHSNTHEMIPIVSNPATVSSFPGLWPVGNMLPSSDSFAFDSKHLLLASSWRSQQALLLCCDEDDSLSRLPLPVDAPVGASFNLYDVDRATGRILVGVSNLATPEALYVGELRVLKPGETVAIGADFLPVCLVHKDGSAATDAFADRAVDEDGDEVDELDENDAYAQIKYTRVLAPAQPLHPEAQRRLEAMRMEIIQVPVPAGEKYADGQPMLPFEAVLLTSANPAAAADKSTPLPPLLAFPHGGPHGASPTSFVPHVAYMSCVGFSVLYINYRGSTAFGQAALESLPGKCGDQDVRDCIAAIEAVLARTGKDAVCSRDNIHVQGGSHGGFLTTHLIGQSPSLFQTAVARNPVCNIAGMLCSSDIPDWSFFEGLGRPYDPKHVPTADEYRRLFEVSPIAHVGKVQTPLLMLLGGSDRRVPTPQAHDYAKLLKSRGVPTRILFYPDGKHPLAESVQMEGDVWVSMMMWALKRFEGADFSLLPMQGVADAQ